MSLFRSDIKLLIVMTKHLFVGLLLLAGSVTVQAADEFAGTEQCRVCHNNMSGMVGRHDEVFTGEGKHLLPGGNEEYRCEACHGPSGSHARRQSGGPWQLPPAVFSSEQGVAIGNAMCSECHAEAMKNLDSHARTFHATAQRNELSCNRCHRGVAHGLPQWVVDLRERQKEEQAP